MSNHLHMFIPVSPFGKQRPHAAHRGGVTVVYTPEQTLSVEAEIRFYARQALNVDYPDFVPWCGAVKLELTAYVHRPKSAKNRVYPISKPDLSNIVKIFEDALNGIIWVDDCQIVSITTSKLYAESPEGVGFMAHIQQLNTAGENSGKKQKLTQKNTTKKQTENTEIDLTKDFS